MALHKKADFTLKNGIEIGQFKAGIITSFKGLQDPSVFYLSCLPSLPCLLCIQIGCWSPSYHTHIQERREDGEQWSFPRYSTSNFC